jgi:hypothetical protein
MSRFSIFFTWVHNTSTVFSSFTLSHWYQTPDRNCLPSCALFLKKKVILFKIVLLIFQIVFLSKTLKSKHFFAHVFLFYFILFL